MRYAVPVTRLRPEPLGVRGEAGATLAESAIGHEANAAHLAAVHALEPLVDVVELVDFDVRSEEQGSELSDYWKMASSLVCP